MKARVYNLRNGDVIDPPAAEKVWLWANGTKRLYTISSIETGKRTKRGQFIKINATVPSPYRNEEPIDISCQMLSGKLVTLR